MATDSIVSAFWINYVCPRGCERERCICELPECGVEIRDGRLCFVTADGLITYLCWLRKRELEGRAGATPRELRSATPHPRGAPGLRARLARWWRAR